MATRYYIYSTCTCDQLYTEWEPAGPGGSHHSVIKQILIRGGSNVADKNFQTARGVRTEVTEEEYALLNKNEVFLRHYKAGFISMREEKVDPEVVVADGMQQADDSAPITPNDKRLENEIGVKPMEERPTVVDRLKGMVGL